MSTTIIAPHNRQAITLDGDPFTAFCQAIHLFNTQWWRDENGDVKDRNVGEMIALMHSELSEALEAHRKNLKDDHLPEFDGVDVELVDCIIRAMDLLGARFVARQRRMVQAGFFNNPPAVAYTPGEVLIAKCVFNSIRADHRPENRSTEHGKKY